MTTWTPDTKNTASYTADTKNTATWVADTNSDIDDQTGFATGLIAPPTYSTPTNTRTWTPDTKN